MRTKEKKTTHRLSVFALVLPLFLAFFTFPTWRSHRQCLKTSRSVRSIFEKQRQRPWEAGDDCGRAATPMLDDDAEAPSRSNSANRPRCPALGFGEPSLKEVVRWSVSTLLERERTRRNEALRESFFFACVEGESCSAITFVLRSVSPSFFPSRRRLRRSPASGEAEPRQNIEERSPLSEALLAGIVGGLSRRRLSLRTIPPSSSSLVRRPPPLPLRSPRPESPRRAASVAPAPRRRSGAMATTETKKPAVAASASPGNDNSEIEATTPTTSSSEGDEGATADDDSDKFGLPYWEKQRREWVSRGASPSGDGKKGAPPGGARAPVIDPDANYDDLLLTNEAFERPIPLPEMVDFLVDTWIDDGLY